MRILVMSDCHGNLSNAQKALEKHKDINKVLYLGDGAAQFLSLNKFYPNMEFNVVCGNCDWNSPFPFSSQTEIEGVTVFYTHGHKYGVKYGTEQLFELGQQMKAGLLLYGHTHIAKIEYRDGIYAVNPGALYGSREGGESYAIIDITKQGIMPNIIKV